MRENQTRQVFPYRKAVGLAVTPDVFRSRRTSVSTSCLQHWSVKLLSVMHSIQAMRRATRSILPRIHCQRLSPVRSNSPDTYPFGKS